MTQKLIILFALIPVLLILIFTLVFKEEIIREIKESGVYIFIFYLPFFLISIFLLRSGYKSLKLSRIIELLPTRKIRSLPMGLVEVKGKVVLPENKKLISPITNKECVYYSCVIYKIIADSRGIRRQIIHQTSNSIPFYIQDDTGSIMVDPKKASIMIDCSKKLSGSEISADPRIRDFVISKVPLYRFYLTTLELEEFVLKPGDEIYIIGVVKDNPYVEEASSEDRVSDKIIAYDSNVKVFVISTYEEKSIAKWLKKIGLVYLFMGFCFMFFSLVVFFI